MERHLFNDLGQLDEFISNQIREKMKEQGLAYNEAYRAFASQNPALTRLREALYRQQGNETINLKTYKFVKDHLEEIDNEIGNLVKDAMKEHPEMEYRQALAVIASEHPGLLRTREQLWAFLA